MVRSVIQDNITWRKFRMIFYLQSWPKLVGHSCRMSCLDDQSFFTWKQNYTPSGERELIFQEFGIRFAKCPIRFWPGLWYRIKTYMQFHCAWHWSTGFWMLPSEAAAWLSLIVWRHMVTWRLKYQEHWLFNMWFMQVLDLEKQQERSILPLANNMVCFF